MTFNEMTSRLEEILGFFQEVELSAELMTTNTQVTIPTLITAVENENTGLNQPIVINLMPMDEETDYTDFFQFYAELDVNLQPYPELLLCKALNKLNQKLLMGCCYALTEQQGLKIKRAIGLRYVFTASNEDPIDEGTFMETFFMFVLSCNVITEYFSQPQDPNN